MRKCKEPIQERRYHLLGLDIDRTSPQPLRVQVYNSVRRAIVSGRLRPGTRLPSTRALARRLKVSRNTILAAYEALLAEGLLVGKVGSSTRVRELVAETVPTPRLPHPSTLLRDAHYPTAPQSFEDLDGNLLYVHRGRNYSTC